jgi:hypothetical protein
MPVTTNFYFQLILLSMTTMTVNNSQPAQPTRLNWSVIAVILVAMLVGLIPYAPRLLSSNVENQLSGIDYSLNGYTVSCEARGTDARQCEVVFPRNLDLAPQSVELTAPEFPAPFSVRKLPVLQTIRVQTPFNGETLARDAARTALYRDIHKAIKLANDKVNEQTTSAAQNKASYLNSRGY